MSVSVRIKTQMAYEQLEDLLQKSCKGAFEISFEGLDAETNRKVMALQFETQADLDAFRAALKAR